MTGTRKNAKNTPKTRENAIKKMKNRANGEKVIIIPIVPVVQVVPVLNIDRSNYDKWLSQNVKSGYLEMLKVVISKC